MAYPYGAFDDTVVQALALAGICYSRTTICTEKFTIPEDWLRLNPTCHYKNPLLTELGSSFLALNPKMNPQMFYVWGHSYEFDQLDNWDVMDQFAQQMTGREDVWYATNW